MKNLPTVLFICGSMNQTTQMHKIAQHLPQFDCWFTPFYVDGTLEVMRKMGMLENNGVGSKLAGRCFNYLRGNNLQIDYGGTGREYDLIITCSDLYIQRNIKGRKLLLVQEGMTDPENFMYHLVRWCRFPRFLASTAATGLSHAYDYFCVASNGYRDLFIGKGVNPATIRVTGIPNFDDCARFLNNDFPFHNYVLAVTSDMREMFKYENRREFIERCVRIADGRQLIFKLHPNERVERATSEIERWASDAIVFPTGNTDHMIANCDVMVARISSTVYVGLALGKEVHSDFDLQMLRSLTPIQNGGTSAAAIAQVARLLHQGKRVPDSYEELHAMAAAQPHPENVG